MACQDLLLTYRPRFSLRAVWGDIYAAVIAVTVLCTIAVALRFRCRRIVKENLWWDDWTILAAMLVEWSLPAVLLYETANLKFGRHIELLQKWQFVPFFKNKRMPFQIKACIH